MLNVQDLVAAHLYASEEAVIQDAVRLLLRERSDLRIGLAIYRYEHEDISLAKAAALAGVSWPQMREILVERGVQPRLGPETLEEARAEAQVLRDDFEG
ncbi:MAG: UPF0175 family protein [Anaerolineae bacterium]